ncbi:MAG TPA: ABC transporter permease [Clostridia bacterium]|nr:ABC transporter permease [Clostridia bacterium]
MKLRHALIVFKKEVKDLIRDKRTIISSIFLPMVLIPLLNIVMSGGVQSFEKSMNENVSIALSQDSNTPEIRKLIQDRILSVNPNLKLVDTGDPVQALKNEEVRCVIGFESGYAEKIKQGMPFKITLQYDESKTKSRTSVDIVSGAIGEFENSIVKERLAALGISEDILKPVEIERQNMAENNQGSNMMLQMFLPFMIGMLIAIGGIPAATDLVAGEKERYTFEPLLTTMPDRGSLLFGKYLAVTLFSFVSVAAILTGLVIGYVVNPNTLTMGIDASSYGGLSIQPLALLLAFLITAMLGMTFSGIQIAISTFAKSYKEAQTYLSFLMIVAMVPGYATMFLQPGDLTTIFFVFPILNTIAAFKMILGGVINYGSLILALGTSVLFVALTLWIAASMFKKEKYLFRS